VGVTVLSMESNPHPGAARRPLPMGEVKITAAPEKIPQRRRLVSPTARIDIRHVVAGRRGEKRTRISTPPTWVGTAGKYRA